MMGGYCLTGKGVFGEIDVSEGAGRHFVHKVVARCFNRCNFLQIFFKTWWTQFARSRSSRSLYRCQNLLLAAGFEFSTELGERTSFLTGTGDRYESRSVSRAFDVSALSVPLGSNIWRFLKLRVSSETIRMCRHLSGNKSILGRTCSQF